MPTPVGLGLPRFVRPELAERVRRQESAIGRRLSGRSASLDAALQTGLEVGETVANAASLVGGAGIVILAAKIGGTWAVAKTVGIGVGIYLDTKVAETALHKAGASHQTIRAELAAAVITLRYCSQGSQNRGPTEALTKTTDGCRGTRPAGEPAAPAAANAWRCAAAEAGRSSDYRETGSAQMLRLSSRAVSHRRKRPRIATLQLIVADRSMHLGRGVAKS